MHALNTTIIEFLLQILTTLSFIISTII